MSKSKWTGLILGLIGFIFPMIISFTGLPLLRANPAALNQVWSNINMSSADAIGKNGFLSIRSNHDNEYVWVFIQDSGPDIKEEVIDKIFEPNFSTKKSEVKFGLGLGLSICKNIVEQYCGAISETTPVMGVLFLRFACQLNRRK